MPIKIPKGFQRRKSSGNVLDETTTPESSFKVFPRPGSSGQILDNVTARNVPPPIRKNSFEDEDEDLFTVMRPDPSKNRGSGGTDHSVATAQYDSAASSSRLSSSSTNPSSVDTRSDKNPQSTIQRAYTDLPVAPQQQSRTGGFLRNAGRTFSFGLKSQKERSNSPPPPPPPVPAPATKHRFSLSSVRPSTGGDFHGRERSTTTSSITTATPPRLLESDITLNTNDLDTFGNMFATIGARSREPSPARADVVQMTSPPYSGKNLHPSAINNGQSRPFNVGRAENMESSPYSWTSTDGLMQSPSPSNTVTQNSPQNRAFVDPMQSDLRSDDNMFSQTPSRPRAYSRPARQTGPPPTAFPGSSILNSPQSPKTVLSIPEQSLEQDDGSFDPSLMDSAALATRYQESKPSPRSKKIMTPQQYERYRQQQDERFRLNKAFGKTDSDESGDDYDDEDEDETARDRQAQNQRKRQEAHLAVYRQTMIKVTGEATPSSAQASHSLGVNPGASSSSYDLSNRLSTLNFEPGSGAKSPAGRSSDDDDEDDEVPLGILAAHGFPNKNRPPTRLTNVGSNPNLRGLRDSQAQSVAGESINRNSLPAFARKLPEDPYYGAGLVNPAHRESIAFHSYSSPNVPTLNTPSGASTNHPHHPAGLIGVIAGEERARAARRGSPNPTNGQYELPQSMPAQPGMLRSQTMGPAPGMMPGMPMMPMMPGMTPGMSAGDHAQIQMSQQMTQMMHMQMQWMQQMQQFMAAGGTPQGMGPMPLMPQMEGAAPTAPRPQSVPLQNMPGTPGRTMSSLDPSMANWNLQVPAAPGVRPNSSYTPSIAPSERSNVGLASRYRPVSTYQEPANEAPWQKRSSTMTSTSFRPWSVLGGSKPAPAAPAARKTPQPADDDDDEAGWAEMKAKKEKKQRTWKLRKGNNPLQELYNGSS